jgi:hypothetical protein
MSHQFERLFLAQYMNILTKDTYQVMLVKTGNAESSIDQTCSDSPAMRTIETFPNYTERPTSLGDLSLYEFTCFWQVIKRRRSSSNSGSDSDSDHSDLESQHRDPVHIQFRPQHPYFKTHCLRRRKLEVIPHILGNWVPSFSVFYWR